MGSFWGHLHTINHHRRLVRQGCFRMGLYWQGLTHDLSKYAPVEFLTGVRYYQGTRSPNTAEREEKGWSEAWMHHKGRNRHHWEYWTDLDMQTKAYAAVPMPPKYLAEMVADRDRRLQNVSGFGVYGRVGARLSGALQRSAAHAPRHRSRAPVPSDQAAR